MGVISRLQQHISTTMLRQVVLIVLVVFLGLALAAPQAIQYPAGLTAADCPNYPHFPCNQPAQPQQPANPANLNCFNFPFFPCTPSQG